MDIATMNCIDNCAPRCANPGGLPAPRRDQRKPARLCFSRPLPRTTSRNYYVAGSLSLSSFLFPSTPTYLPTVHVQILPSV